MTEQLTRKVRILHVDDNDLDLKLYGEALRDAGYEVVTAGDVKTANDLILASLQPGGMKYDIVVTDLNLGIGQASGADFGRRVMDIAGYNLVILTGFFYKAAGLFSFKPDGTVIKDDNYNQTCRDLLSTLRRLTEPKRNNTFSAEIKIKLWEVTRPLSGINELDLMTAQSSDTSSERSVNKLIFINRDGKVVVGVLLPRHRRERFVTIRVQTTVGCDQCCPTCGYWRKAGHAVYCLTPGEVSSQFYHMVIMMISDKFAAAFLNDPKLGISIQFMGQGDLGNNLENCVKAIFRFIDNEVVPITTLLSTVGIRSALQFAINDNLKIPGATWAFTLYSPDQDIREIFVPGSRGCPVEEWADMFQQISVQNGGQKIDLSVTLVVGMNDSREDAKKVADFCKRWPFFRVVLLAGCCEEYSGRLKGIPDTPIKTVKLFRQWLIAEGIKDSKIRRNPGSKGQGAGFGQAVLNF